MIIMSKNASAILKVSVTSTKTSITIQKSLKPETKALFTNRSKVKIKCEEKTITLFFEANNTTALRSSMNLYLNWIKLLQDICGSLEARTI